MYFIISQHGMSGSELKEGFRFIYCGEKKKHV